MKYSESSVKNLVLSFILILTLSTIVSYSIGSRDGFNEAEYRYNIESNIEKIDYGKLIFKGNPPDSYSLFVSEGDTLHLLFEYHHIGGLELAPR